MRSDEYSIRNLIDLEVVCNKWRCIYIFDPDYTTKVQREKLFTHFFIGPDNVCYRIRSNEVMMVPFMIGF